MRTLIANLRFWDRELEAPRYSIRQNVSMQTPYLLVFRFRIDDADIRSAVFEDAHQFLSIRRL
jgi:hypothetical protein